MTQYQVQHVFLMEGTFNVFLEGTVLKGELKKNKKFESLNNSSTDVPLKISAISHSDPSDPSKASIQIEANNAEEQRQIKKIIAEGEILFFN